MTGNMKPGMMVGDFMYVLQKYPGAVMNNLMDWSLESVQVVALGVFDTYAYPQLQQMVRQQTPGLMRNTTAAAVEKVRDTVKSTNVM